MNEFDTKAAAWDSNSMHHDRSAAIVDKLLNQIPFDRSMTALEYGAGTGLASFLLKDHLKEITMMDSSPEMVRIMKEKVETTGSNNLKALLFDLEKVDLDESEFDLVFTQMVLHHVSDIKNIIRKFCNILKPGGFLAIADLYPEDGSFHGEDFLGHKGFDPCELSALVNSLGFENTGVGKCFVIKKKISELETRQFDVFLLITRKS